MIREIADSDAESDYEIGDPLQEPPNNTSQTNGITTELITSAGLLGIDDYGPPGTIQVDFDQFLSQTQSLSRGLASQETALRIGSDKMNSQEDLQTISSRKRRLNAIEDGRKPTRDAEEDVVGREKKLKTYATSERTRSEQMANNYVNDLQPSEHERTINPRRLSLDYISPETGIHSNSNDPQMYADGPCTTPRQRDRPRRVISLLNQSVDDHNHQVSTSKASMGAYQSITLDFRGSGMGMDVTTNPFGSLSQISLDGESNSPETEKFSNLIRSHIDSINRNDLQDESAVETDPKPAEVNHISPEIEATHHANAYDASASIISEEQRNEGDAERTQPQSKSRQSSILSVDENLERPIGNSESTHRKRKTKAGRSQSKTSNTDAHDHDAHSMRATTESLSQISQNQEDSTTTKGKKKKSKKEERELDLNEATGIQDDSPSKQLSSELNLSDELLVGLPKETYKPRPSRSRSKRVEDETQPLDQTLDVQNETTVEPNPQTEITLAPTKGKRGRKAKVKRAKTSAAALLARSEQMLSDGDEDVVWMDTKPAPVNLELPPDIFPMKTENIKPELRAENESAESPSISKTEEISTKPPIEKPDLIEIQAAPKPAKRGRKPKKSTVIEEDVVSKMTEDEGTEKMEQLHKVAGKDVLQEKDTNIILPLPEKQDKTSELPQSPSKDKIIEPENLTPSKATTSPEKGPTRHSPINPPDARFRFKYRVGLSRRQHIPPLLRKVDKTKEPPKIVPRKEKKKKGEVDLDIDPDADPADRPVRPLDRDANGNLVEWDF